MLYLETLFGYRGLVPDHFTCKDSNFYDLLKPRHWVTGERGSSNKIGSSFTALFTYRTSRHTDQVSEDDSRVQESKRNRKFPSTF